MTTNENPIERLNNAIALLDRYAMGDVATPPGSRRAIHDLAEHWAKWFATDERWGGVTSVAAKLEKYARWYQRAYLIASPAVQARVPLPSEAAPEYSEVLALKQRQWFEGLQDAGRAGISATEYVGKSALELANAVADRATGVAQGLGLVAVALAAIYLSRK